MTSVAGDARKERERERSRRRRAAQLEAQGRQARSYVRGGAMPLDEYKRLARLCGRPGYEPIKQQAHVQVWTAYVRAVERDQERLQRMAKAKHQAHVVLWKSECSAAWFRHQYHTDPQFNARQKMRASLRKKSKLDGAIASGMASNLKRERFGKGWQSLLGYTPADLIAHLRRTLPKGRTWDHFMSGRLHIDHITPCADFDLTRLDEVRACWSLGNLRLIDGAANLRKSAKREFLL